MNVYQLQEKTDEGWIVLPEIFAKESTAERTKNDYTQNNPETQIRVVQTAVNLD